MTGVVFWFDVTRELECCNGNIDSVLMNDDISAGERCFDRQCRNRTTGLFGCCLSSIDGCVRVCVGFVGVVGVDAIINAGRISRRGGRSRRRSRAHSSHVIG